MKKGNYIKEGFIVMNPRAQTMEPMALIGPSEDLPQTEGKETLGAIGESIKRQYIISSPEEGEHFGGAGNVLQTLKCTVKSVLERQ